ncbi:putative metallodependent hydrolase [Burkholderiales bacterium]|nr:putative metallodependent hydrolase [Burkholderiales bacterium]
MLIDSHCHLCFPELRADADGVLSRMRAAGVAMALNISTSMRDLLAVVEFAQQHEGIFASVGVHPDNTEEEEPDVATLVTHARADKVVAVGETGLDYFRLQEPLDWQRARFRTHIRAARESGKPLVIHTRASAQDTLRIMREERADEVGGVMHCFTEGADVARAAMDLGFLISFSGIITFKSAQALRDVASIVPDERLLVETDAPYLAPVPHRGKTNEPAWVTHVADTLAHLRKQPIEHIQRITTDNFFRLFNIL